jgi:hypothetical protein
MTSIDAMRAASPKGAMVSRGLNLFFESCSYCAFIIARPSWRGPRTLLVSKNIFPAI